MGKEALGDIVSGRILALAVMAAVLSWTLGIASGTGVSAFDAAELEAFFDGLMTAQVRAYQVPGAALSVVADGEILLAKGYGFADLEARTPVTADGTLFRVASVTKLFTWTAVMQLVEEGRLDLDADVNEYLEDFQIPPTYPEAITLKHLMTHTAGFDQPVGISALNEDDLRPLGEVLEDSLPERVRPPGELSAYSNWGAALAGFIVEEVSGMAFERYVEERILEPLEMSRTTARQPPPDELADHMAVGCRYTQGAYHPEPFFYHQLGPAISISSTAADMARFMIAHLGDGSYGDGRILGEEAVRQMRAQLFTHDPDVSGWAHGFMEMEANDHRLLWHRGSWWPQFYSLLALLPEHGVGIFVSYNGPGGGVARSALLRAFLDRYYPATGEVQEPMQSPSDLRPFAGSYRSTSRAYRTFEKLEDLFDQVQLTVEADGSLLMTGFGDPQHWVMIGPLVFHASGRQPFFSRDLVFRRDEEGRITHFFLSNDPRFAFERVPWYETVPFNLGFLVVCGVLFLSVMIWPVGFVVRRFHGRPAPGPRLPRLARSLTGSICVLNLFCLGVLFISGIDAGPAYGIPVAILALLLGVTLTSALAVGSTALVMLAWRGRYWDLAPRIHYTVVTLAALAFVWWLANWNLLGLNY